MKKKEIYPSGEKGGRCMSKNKIIAFSYYGGKFSHLKWLLPLLPKTITYCEPFGGSAAVLLNKEPSKMEIYNDLDSSVVNFFKVLRDKPDELIEKISLTPYSRWEYEYAVKNKGNPELSDVERARLFYVSVRQGYNSSQISSIKDWSYNINQREKPKTWKNSFPKLYLVAERLLHVHIEYKPAIDVIKRYDSTDTLFYCDPPYPHECRKSKKVYFGEMSDEEHIKLAEVLHSVKGKVAISSYHCQLMDKLYSDWNYIDAPNFNPL